MTTSFVRNNVIWIKNITLPPISGHNILLLAIHIDKMSLICSVSFPSPPLIVNLMLSKMSCRRKLHRAGNLYLVPCFHLHPFPSLPSYSFTTTFVCLGEKRRLQKGRESIHIFFLKSKSKKFTGFYNTTQLNSSFSNVAVGFCWCSTFVCKEFLSEEEISCL